MRRRQLLGAPFAAGVLAVTAAWANGSAQAAQAVGNGTAAAGTNPAATDAGLRPARVVVIGGALAECVYALGAQGRLVGADTTCTYPAATASLPKVGYQRSLSTEGILSLRPALVLSSQEAGPPTVFTQLRDAGIRVVSVEERHDVETARRKLTVTADALGIGQQATPLLQQFDTAWQTTRAHIASVGQQRGQQQPLRVLFVLGHSGMQSMVAGQHTAADAMIQYAGARNAIDAFSGYRVLTPEAAGSAAPDVILTTDDALKSAGGAAAFAANPALALTPAGRAGRVIAMDDLLLLGFGPRLPLAVSQLSDRIFSG